jgi:GntR family transcriptional regulator
MPEDALLLRIDLASNVPVYRQIVNYLRALLVDNVVQAGDTLPPVRQLALDLGIHFNTVAEAYRTLAEEGWLDLKPRRGALVIERSRPGTQDPEKAEGFARRVREMIAEAQSDGLSAASIAQELTAIVKGLEK